MNVPSPRKWWSEYVGIATGVWGIGYGVYFSEWLVLVFSVALAVVSYRLIEVQQERDSLRESGMGSD